MKIVPLLFGFLWVGDYRLWSRLILVGSVLVALSGCDAAKTPTGRKPGANQTAIPPRKVQTAPVVECSVERSIVALGSLMAYQRATLSAKVAGRVQSIPVDLGSVVKRGDVVARIELRDYELKVRQAESALVQARAVLGLPFQDGNDQIDLEKVSAVKEARAVLAEAQSSRDRTLRLSREKISSPSQVDTAEAAYLVALNRLQDAQEKTRQQQALVAQRRVELEIARQQLADATMVAPFDGGVQERRTDVGEYLTVGLPVVTLVRLDPLRLRLEVSERDAAQVRLGQTVRFTPEGDTNVFTVRIQRISPALVEATRMLTVEADVPNDGRLHPGSFASAEIVTRPDAKALTIPTNSIVNFAGLEKAFTVKAGKAVEKRIITGKWFPESVEVVSGLAAGEEVILNPGSLQAGQPVVKDR